MPSWNAQVQFIRSTLALAAWHTAVMVPREKARAHLQMQYHRWQHDTRGSSFDFLEIH